MSRQQQTILKHAICAANRSTSRNRHCAVIVSSNSILALGINKDKNSPLVSVANASVHAEIAAIKQLKKIPKRATIYIARINKAGKPALSKPCSKCAEVIERLGIRTVIYTV